MWRFLSALWLFGFILSLSGNAARNPAVVYCEILGYDWRIEEGPTGQRTVVEVEPGVTFDAWEFYQGKVGQEYSYGGLRGYETICRVEKQDACQVEYAVCLPTAELRQQGLEPVSQLDLMKENGDWPATGERVFRSPPDPSRGVTDEFAAIELDTLPASFDWRNRSGSSYIGAVRDQGSCGACYSFGACAAAESTYNLANGLTGGSCIDLSESFIIWCLGRISPYSDHFFGCDGADYDYYELQALVDEGICYESAFPYTETDPGSCTHADDPRISFNSWSRVPCNDVPAIKTAMMTYGAIDAAVQVTGSFESYSSGVFQDSNTSCSANPCYYQETNHAIALVGWDDNPPEGGGGVWILRNSWGTSWGENGYMRIRYGSAAVNCAATYLVYNAGPQPTVTATSDAPPATPTRTSTPGSGDPTPTNTLFVINPTATPTPDVGCEPDHDPIGCGQTLNGLLEESDEDAYYDGTRVDYFSFALATQTDVTLRLNGPGFLAYLEVAPNQSGCVGDYIDSSFAPEVGGEAVLQLSLAAGSYYALANNFFEQPLPLPYTITLECAGGPAPTITATNTAVPTASQTPTEPQPPTITPTTEPQPTPTATEPLPEPTASATRTQPLDPTVTETPLPQVTPTATASEPDPTATFTKVPASPTPSATVLLTPTSTQEPQPTVTETPLPVTTSTQTPQQDPTPTQTGPPQATASPTPQSQPTMDERADVDGNGQVDNLDLLILLSNWHR